MGKYELFNAILDQMDPEVAEEINGNFEYDDGSGPNTWDYFNGPGFKMPSCCEIDSDGNHHYIYQVDFETDIMFDVKEKQFYISIGDLKKQMSRKRVEFFRDSLFCDIYWDLDYVITSLSHDPSDIHYDPFHYISYYGSLKEFENNILAHAAAYAQFEKDFKEVFPEK